MLSLLYEFRPREKSIRSLLYYLNKKAQLLIHFVHGQRITPMSNARAVYSWESQHLGQVTTRYPLPVNQLRPRLYVETLSGI